MRRLQHDVLLDLNFARDCASSLYTRLVQVNLNTAQGAPCFLFSAARAHILRIYNLLMKISQIFASSAAAYTVQLTRNEVTEPVTPLHHMLKELRQEHRLQSGADFTIDMVNNGDLSYTGPVFVGTPLQGSNSTNYVYDTGSGYLTIPSSSCTNCDQSFLYDSAASSTYESGSSDYTTNNLSYGSATLYGGMATDTVCLSDTTQGTEDSCVTDFSFFMISSETGLNGIQGILGLSPAASGNGPSYAKALKD